MHPQMEDLPRIAFMHIPKTGGNSLLRSLFRIYPAHTRTLHLSSKAAPCDASEKRLIAGHFGYAFAKQLDASLITVLRDPAERVLSLYYFWRRLPPDRGRNAQIARSLTLAEFLESNDPAVVSNIRNAQVWQIAHASDRASRRELGDLKPDDLLDLAKSNLEKFAVVGTIENPVALAVDLYRKTNIALRGFGRANATADRAGLQDMSTDIRRLVDRCTRLDQALYRFALKRFEISV
jgi:hypothetical protein